jgi:hypothetical protein
LIWFGPWALYKVALAHIFHRVKCTQGTQIIGLLPSRYSDYQNDYLGTWTIVDAHQRSKTCHVRDIFSKRTLYVFSFSQNSSYQIVVCDKEKIDRVSFEKNVHDVACFRPLVCIGNSSGTQIVILIVRVPRWKEANSLSTVCAFYS